MKKYGTVIKQSAFCLDLMKRLNEKIISAKVEYGMIEYHTRMENEVVRLRNELNELNHMLRQYGYE